MGQIEDRQKYYEYDPRQQNWWLKDPPSRELWFERALVDLAGMYDGRFPRLRVVWGGSVMHDITYRPTLKYKAVRQYTKGYNYLKTDGEIGFVTSMNLATDAVEPWKFEPVKERIEIGRLRWVIEQHVPPDELRRQKRFENPYAQNGERILRDFPPDGIYQHFFWVQTGDFKYRDLDHEVLTAVQAMFLYNVNTSEAQKALDQIEREKKQTLIGAEEARSIWAGMTQ